MEKRLRQPTLNIESDALRCLTMKHTKPCLTVGFKAKFAWRQRASRRKKKRRYLAKQRIVLITQFNKLLVTMLPPHEIIVGALKFPAIVNSIEVIAFSWGDSNEKVEVLHRNLKWRVNSRSKCKLSWGVSVHREREQHDQSSTLEVISIRAKDTKEFREYVSHNTWTQQESESASQSLRFWFMFIVCSLTADIIMWNACKLLSRGCFKGWDENRGKVGQVCSLNFHR